MHTDLHASARAQLAALAAEPHPRCRAGAHIGGPGCQVHPEVDLLEPHGPCQLCEQVAPAPIVRGLRAVPFEVWAARR